QHDNVYRGMRTSRRWLSRRGSAALLVSLLVPLHALQPQDWHDPTRHTVRFVTADKDVPLEVLDWGGSGRALVLLAGGGGTAHVFDDFAPRLTGTDQVDGISARVVGG